MISPSVSLYIIPLLCSDSDNQLISDLFGHWSWGLFSSYNPWTVAKRITCVVACTRKCDRVTRVWRWYVTWPMDDRVLGFTSTELAKHWRSRGGVTMALLRRFWCPGSGWAGWFFQSNWLDSRHPFREMVRHVWRTGRKTKHRRQPQQLLNEIVLGDLQLEPGMWKQCPPHAVWSDLHKGSAAATVKRMKKRYRFLRILGLQSSINEVALIQESSLQ